MKVILLAAGFGTRLRPITNKIPKCLVPIKGKPLLQIWLENLTKSGLNSFLINTHYLHLEVEKFVFNSEYKNLCSLFYEEELLGTAGTIIRNLDFANNEDLLVIHADNYCLQDMKTFIDAHNSRPNGCLMTMMTFRTENPSSCGIVEIDEHSIVKRFFEKVDNPPNNLANGAVYILSKEFLTEIKDRFDFNDFSTQVIPNYCSKIFTFETNDIFIDIGTLESFNKANYHL
jgi:mannose-1-phosphate guanylyltransferase